jgi:hypothetical protein
VPRSRIGLGRAIAFTLALALLLVGSLGYGALWLLGLPCSAGGGAGAVDHVLRAAEGALLR